MKFISIQKLLAAAALSLTGCADFIQNPLANAFHIPFDVKGGAAYPLPKRPFWFLKGGDFSKAAVLPDAHSLYVYHYSREQVTGSPGTLLDGYHFYRFWPDGHVIHRSCMLPHPPTSADGDDFRESQRWNYHVGYYRVVGSRISIELFYAEEGGRYDRTDGELSADGIAITEQIHRNYVFHYNRVPFPKNAMSQRPDW